MVAWLRTCGLAEFSSASAMTGNCSTTAGWAATSAIVAAAPSRRPCGPTSMRSSRRPARLTSRSGRRTYLLQELHHVGAAGDVFGGRVVAAGLGAQSEGGGQIARPFEGEGVHGSTLPHGTGGARRILNRRDDVVVGAAAAQVAAHPVADLLRRAGVALGDAGDAGHDLPRRAVAALEGVTLDEGRLQRVELVRPGPGPRWS